MLLNDPESIEVCSLLFSTDSYKCRLFTVRYPLYCVSEERRLQPEGSDVQGGSEGSCSQYDVDKDKVLRRVVYQKKVFPPGPLGGGGGRGTKPPH